MMRKRPTETDEKQQQQHQQQFVASDIDSDDDVLERVELCRQVDTIGSLELSLIGAVVIILLLWFMYETDWIADTSS